MQITPAVHGIRHFFKVHVEPGIAIERFVYSYLITGETITLIDTGVAGCEIAIFEYIRSIGRDPCEVSLIILTHSHPGHLGAAHAIRETTGCSIMAHGAERDWIEDVDRQNRERPVPGFPALVGGPVPLDHALVDGDEIDPDGTGDYELQVFHTPGHSAGSIALLLSGERVLFSGDAVPVDGDLPVYEDVQLTIRSIMKLQAIRGIRVLLSSWDDPRENEAAYIQMDRARAYLQKVHDTVINASTDGTREPMDIAKKTAPVLGLPPQAVNPLLARTLNAHIRVRDLKDLSAGP